MRPDLAYVLREAVLVGFLQKQTVQQRFVCKLFIWELIPGNTGREME